MHGFKFTSAVQKFVVVFMSGDELMFAEIKNFPIEKGLWEAELLFNPDIRGYVVMIATVDNYVCNHSLLTKEECDVILHNIRDTYFKG